VTRDQGDQLTNIEMRINSLLPEYELKKFKPTHATREISHVEEPVEAYEPPEFHIP
jgi:hypothetical protein